jgi:hypothetical protein
LKEHILKPGDPFTGTRVETRWRFQALLLWDGSTGFKLDSTPTSAEQKDDDGVRDLNEEMPVGPNRVERGEQVVGELLRVS